jgi:hypothetical protein
MNQTFEYRPFAMTLFIALFVSYVSCILACVLFGWQMHEAWAPLLPGFTWPATLTGTLIGLLWIVGYSLYVAALVVFPFNYFVRKSAT